MKIRRLAFAILLLASLTGCDGQNLRQSADMKSSSWSPVMHLSGSGDASSRAFTLSGGQARIFFTVKRDDANSFAIYLAQAGKNLQKDGYLKRFDLSTPETERFTVPPGKYYLSVASVEYSEWTVSIDEFR